MCWYTVTCESDVLAGCGILVLNGDWYDDWIGKNRRKIIPRLVQTNFYEAFPEKKIPLKLTISIFIELTPPPGFPVDLP